MPQIRVNLPDDLYGSVKEHGLSPADLLQTAIHDELRRRQMSAETERYLAELIDEVGEPSETAVAKAEALVRRIRNGGTGEDRAASLPTKDQAVKRRQPSFVAMGTSSSGRRASESDDMLADGFGADRSH